MICRHGFTRLFTATSLFSVFVWISVNLCLILCLAGCAAVDIATDLVEDRPPKPTIDDERNPVIVIETNRGSITAELYEREVPNIVAYFIYLIDSGVYTNRAFYKADDKAVDAGPQAKPLGFRVRREPGAHQHARYALSMKGSRNGALTADLMIMRSEAFDLDSGNTVMGRVTGGKCALSRIRKNDFIKQIYVKRKKSHAYVPTVQSDGPIRSDAP